MYEQRTCIFEILGTKKHVFQITKARFVPLYCRCLDAFCIYGSAGKVEEPYVTITRKKQMPREGQTEEVEQEVGQAEGKLVTHRAAFARTSVIQAFLGSAPQLTLQLYICVLQRKLSIGRGEKITHNEL